MDYRTKNNIKIKVCKVRSNSMIKEREAEGKKRFYLMLYRVRKKRDSERR